jgi:predicted nucleic acid-binding protein
VLAVFDPNVLVSALITPTGLARRVTLPITLSAELFDLREQGVEFEEKPSVGPADVAHRA